MQKDKSLKLIIAIGAAVGLGFSLASTQVFKPNPKGRSVAFMGDSQMANFSASGWQNQMAKMYGLQILPVAQNTGSGLSGTSNLAQVGKTTSWMLSRLNQFYQWGYRPDFLFIYGGGNDVAAGVPTQTIVDNYQKMINLATSHGTKVYIVPGYLSSKVSTTVLDQDQINKRDAYKNMLYSLKGAKIAPLWLSADKTYSSDGLHISDSKKLTELAALVGKFAFGKPVSYG